MDEVGHVRPAQEPIQHGLEVTRPARRSASWPQCVSPPQGSRTASRSRTTIFRIGASLDLAERGVFGLGSLTCQEGAAELGKLVGAALEQLVGPGLEQKPDHVEIRPVERQVGLIRVYGEPDAHCELLLASRVEELCKASNGPFV